MGNKLLKQEITKSSCLKISWLVDKGKLQQTKYNRALPDNLHYKSTRYENENINCNITAHFGIYK